MSKEEVAEIMTYCKEKGISYKSRLEELGIPAWKFFDSKSRYAKDQPQKMMSIELRTPNGTMMRIQGEMTLKS